MCGDGGLCFIDKDVADEKEEECMTVNSSEILDYESRPGFATEWLERNKDKSKEGGYERAK